MIAEPAFPGKLKKTSGPDLQKKRHLLVIAKSYPPEEFSKLDEKRVKFLKRKLEWGTSNKEKDE
jgi:hypothetical protein